MQVGVRLAEAVLTILVALCVGGMGRGGGWGVSARTIDFNVTVGVSDDYNITQIFQADEEGLAEAGLTPDAQLFGRMDADGKVGGYHIL